MSSNKQNQTLFSVLVVIIVAALLVTMIMTARAASESRITGEILRVDQFGFDLGKVFSDEVYRIEFSPRVKCRLYRRGVEMFPCSEDQIVTGDLVTLGGVFTTDNYPLAITVSRNFVRVGEIANLNLQDKSFDLLSLYPETVYKVFVNNPRSPIYVKGRGSAVRSRGVFATLQNGQLVAVIGQFISGNVISDARRVTVADDIDELSLYYQ